MPDDMLEMFRKGLKEARRQQKSDGIIDFIKASWSMFCESRQDFDLICEELGQRGELTVTGLADALGLPEGVLFKKVRAVDAAGLLLDMQKSALFGVFMKQLESRTKSSGKEPQLCMFAVAGKRTVIITNMRIQRVPGKSFVRLDRFSEDICVFPAADAPDRLPVLFRKRSD